VIGRLKCLAIGLDVSVSFFSTSQRGSRNRSPSHVPVSPLYVYFFSISASYAVDNIGGGASKVICTLNGFF